MAWFGFGKKKKKASCCCGETAETKEATCCCGEAAETKEATCCCGEAAETKEATCCCGETKEPAEAGCCCGTATESAGAGCCCGEKTESICCVKVLGAGCKSCHEQFENAQKAVAALGLNLEVEYITDMPKVMEYGVMSMPAIVVNEKVVSQGKILKPAEVEALLQEFGK